MCPIGAGCSVTWGLRPEGRSPLVLSRGRLAGVPSGRVEAREAWPHSPKTARSKVAVKGPRPPHLQGVVDSRLWRVDDKVPQREAEPLRGSAQAERLGSRPGKGLLLRPGGGGGRRLALVTSILLLSLKKEDKQDVTDDPQMLVVAVFMAAWKTSEIPGTVKTTR